MLVEIFAIGWEEVKIGSMSGLGIKELKIAGRAEGWSGRFGPVMRNCIRAPSCRLEDNTQVPGRTCRLMLVLWM